MKPRVSAVLATLAMLVSCRALDDDVSTDAGGVGSGPQPTADSLTIQAPPGTAVLMSGAEAVKGLPFLERNSLPGLGATYAVPGADALAEVWYGPDPVMLPDGFLRVPCPGLGAGWTAYSPGDGASFVLRAPAGYYLYVRWPAGPGACPFLAALAERFEWFRSRAAVSGGLSFPATLDLAGQ
ncbi:MAG: hypothetical protein JW923_10260 [Spirochaetales bacterium]|nr:hypothetical protein [Spirochaetales bacterium]